MKKAIIFLLTACMLICVAGCSAQNELMPPATPTEKVFLVENYSLQITADSTFQKTAGGNFDLQITNDNAYISIMAYKYIDLPEDMAPADIFDLQNEDIFSKRENVKTVEEAKTQSLAQSKITHALYSAERDGVKNYYATYLIDLPNAETCAWVLVTAMPSYLNSNREYLHDIVCSLTSAQ